MTDHSRMKLGKRAPRWDKRTLLFSDYAGALPPPPPSTDYSNQQPEWGAMLNDSLGDCTIAAVAHAVQVWTLVINQRITVADEVVEEYYSLWDGYVSGNPDTDNGGVELDVLRNWRQQGFAGHPLKAFTRVNSLNLDHVQQALNLFGGLYVGLALPITAQRQDTWDVTRLNGDGEPGSWGGHAVFCCAYDRDGVTCITWGQLKRMTWAFWAAYCDECYALVSPDFIADDGIAPSGFDMAALEADLDLVTG